jgi:hypothetical protein
LYEAFADLPGPLLLEADTVYYNGLAYESHPSDERQHDLVEKMMEDEPFLTEEELQVRTIVMICT